MSSETQKPNVEMRPGGVSRVVAVLLGCAVVLMFVAVVVMGLITYMAYRAQQRMAEGYNSMKESVAAAKEGIVDAGSKAVDATGRAGVAAVDATERAGAATTRKFVELRDDPELREAMRKVDERVGQSLYSAELQIKQSAQDLKNNPRWQDWETAVRQSVADRLEAAGKRIRGDATQPEALPARVTPRTNK